jgi:hydrogenase maturation factor
MSLITVYTALNPAEAQLIRGRLEAAGFDASVKNELSALSIDGYALAAGGILVQVPADQAESALELIHAERDPQPGE